MQHAQGAYIHISFQLKLNVVSQSVSLPFSRSTNLTFLTYQDHSLVLFLVTASSPAYRLTYLTTHRPSLSLCIGITSAKESTYVALILISCLLTPYTYPYTLGSNSASFDILRSRTSRIPRFMVAVLSIHPSLRPRLSSNLACSATFVPGQTNARLQCKMTWCERSEAL